MRRREAWLIGWRGSASPPGHQDPGRRAQCAATGRRLRFTTAEARLKLKWSVSHPSVCRLFQPQNVSSLNGIQAITGFSRLLVRDGNSCPQRSLSREEALGSAPVLGRLERLIPLVASRGRRWWKWTGRYRCLDLGAFQGLNTLFQVFGRRSGVRLGRSGSRGGITRRGRHPVSRAWRYRGNRAITRSSGLGGGVTW